jgi:rod shape-determining protein MreC
MRIRSPSFFRRYPIPAFIILLLLSGLVLISMRVKEREGGTFFDALLMEICSPFQSAATSVSRSIGGVFQRYVSLTQVQQENEKLKRRVAELQSENHQMKEMALANVRLRSLLEFRQQWVTSMMGAEVIGQDPSPWFKSVTIDKGEKQGLRKGMAVISPEGVVGQILKTSPDYATVLLITDYNSGIDAIVQRTRAKGIVEGKEGNRCQLKYLLRTEDVEPGDVVITSGLDGKFPKGLMVGEIQGIDKRHFGVFQYAELVPKVDLARLEEVFVITEFSIPTPLPQEDKGTTVRKPTGRSPKKK